MLCRALEGINIQQKCSCFPVPRQLHLCQVAGLSGATWERSGTQGSLVTITKSCLKANLQVRLQWSLQLRNLSPSEVCRLIYWWRAIKQGEKPSVQLLRPSENFMGQNWAKRKKTVCGRRVAGERVVNRSQLEAVFFRPPYITEWQPWWGKSGK